MKYCPSCGRVIVQEGLDVCWRCKAKEPKTTPTKPMENVYEYFFRAVKRLEQQTSLDDAVVIQFLFFTHIQTYVSANEITQEQAWELTDNYLEKFNSKLHQFLYK